ncbi:hypothetical protein ACFCVU_27290 [Peribacillus butanolivorans]|uniref:hypothetical protein n=1 Tax=Peribacillus butanolivorans TaxID=421767 RepID=UPI0035DB6252
MNGRTGLTFLTTLMSLNSIPYGTILPLRIIKVSQLFLVEQFLYRYTITVAGVERSCPFGLDPVN